MAEYIDKEAAIKIVDGIDTWSAGWRYYAIEQLKNLPAASVRENVTGRWIWDDEGYHCSECLYHAYGNTGEVLAGQFLYCPWCGAKLYEEED